jgi:hypothetical protein
LLSELPVWGGANLAYNAQVCIADAGFEAYGHNAGFSVGITPQRPLDTG